MNLNTVWKRTTALIAAFVAVITLMTFAINTSFRAFAADDNSSSAKAIPCGTLLDSADASASAADNEVKIAYNQSSPNYDLGLNQFDYTMNFSVSTSQIRKNASVCFTIDGKNAKYVDGFRVQTLEGSTVAWPSDVSQGYDEQTDTYYYRVTFPEDLAQGTSIEGNINISFKDGYPSIWSEAPLHAYFADTTTNGEFIEQKGSPLKHRFRYGDYAASHFSKFVNAEYGSSQGTNTQKIQVIGGGGEAATDPVTGVHYIPASAARPVKYTFSGRSIYYAIDKIVITDNLPTYTDKDGKQRHAILQCPTAEDTSGTSAAGSTPSDCINDKWVVDEEKGTATLTLSVDDATIAAQGKDRIFKLLQASPIYLAFPDIVLDKTFDDEYNPGIKRYYVEISNHAQAQYEHAGDKGIDTFSANEANGEMDPLVSYLVPEATYGQAGNLTELVRDASNHTPTADDNDYSSSALLMDYVKNKSTNYPWYVGFYNNTSRNKDKVSLTFTAAPGLKITRIDHLIEPVNWVGDSQHGWNIAWTFTQWINQTQYSLQKNIQSITVCFDQEKKDCQQLAEDPANWSYANVGYGLDFKFSKPVQSVTVTLKPDFVVKPGSGIWMQPYTQFVDPQGTSYDPDDLDKNNYVSPASATSANVGSDLLLSSNRIATLSLIAPSDGQVEIHGQNSGYKQGDSDFVRTTTDGQTLSPVNGDRAVFATRMNNETYGGVKYNTELNADAPYKNLRLVFYAPHGVDLSKAEYKGLNGSDNMITRTEVIDNYEGSGQQAFVMYLDRNQYETNLKNAIQQTTIAVRAPLGNDILPGRHDGYFQVEWDEGAYGTKTQKAGTSVQKVEQHFYVDSTAVRTFEKGVVTTMDAAQEFDIMPKSSAVTADSNFYYTLSENFFGQADMPTSVVVDALPRANTTVDPKTGKDTTGPDYGETKLKRDLNVYLTGPVQGIVVKQDRLDGYKVSVSDASDNYDALYTTNPAVQTKSMTEVLADSSIQWIPASQVSDWKSVTGVKVDFTKMARNAITRVLLPVETDHASVAFDSAQAKIPFESDNVAGHLLSDQGEVSEHKVTISMMPRLHVVARSLPRAGGQASTVWLWIISVAVAGILLALLALRLRTRCS